MDLFKTLVYDNFVSYLINGVIFVAVPWLAIPPLSWIITAIVNWVTNALYSVIALFINTELIVLNNSVHQQAYETASESLKIIATEKGLSSDEYKIAHDKEKAALYDLVHFTVPSAA